MAWGSKSILSLGPILTRIYIIMHLVLQDYNGLMDQFTEDHSMHNNTRARNIEYGDPFKMVIHKVSIDNEAIWNYHLKQLPYTKWLLWIRRFDKIVMIFCKMYSVHIGAQHFEFPPSNWNHTCTALEYNCSRAFNNNFSHYLSSIRLSSSHNIYHHRYNDA